jgi:hypothetical protein
VPGLVAREVETMMESVSTRCSVEPVEEYLSWRYSRCDT